ncbi:hypothetical protein INT48_000673 [Thamnidium elegans]|uniref:Uncharacterized protein n=1 Tax=Thamnidium elegans TaxID=101142 RepID=A0A8H7VW51_9FUNG|nr:hypothetical protein INT48_000673 [Thamnidium elegans]
MDHLYSSKPWCPCLLLVTNSSIQSSLTLPLTPFVALSEFLTDQHSSLSLNIFHTDSTVQFLYSIATNIQEQIINNENSIGTLLEEIADVTMWNKTKKALENGKKHSPKLTKESIKLF